MTVDQQRRWYGPAWRRAFVVCWVGGSANPRPAIGRPTAHPDSGLPTPDQVDQVASQIARREFRAAQEKDLRRAVRMIALGRDSASASTLSWKDLQRVVLAFEILADPDNIDRTLRWFSTDAARRKALVGCMLQLGFDQAYLDAMARQIYGAPVADLPIESASAFHRLLRARSARRVGEAAADLARVGGESSADPF